MTTIFDEIAAKKAAMNEAIIAQQVEIEQMLANAKASAMDAYMAKLEELKALSEGFNANFSFDIEVELGLKEPPKVKQRKSHDSSARSRKIPVQIADAVIQKFAEVKAGNPTATVTVLKAETGVTNSNVLKRIDRAFQKANGDFEGMKALLNIA